MIAILADIHGNLYALRKVFEDMKRNSIDEVILLGDLIDYGMQSNEVISFLQGEFEYKITCNIWGNHEHAIMTGDYSGFSTQRGIDCAKYTSSILIDGSRDYIKNHMISSGMTDLLIGDMRCLAVHGSLKGTFWKAVTADNVNGDYREYDVVMSAHSHYSHLFTKFYKTENSELRNQHSVMFINPGSVGQPRNHNANAQYAIFDEKTKSVSMRAIPYDVEAAMSLYDSKVDNFYKQRLLKGI